MLLLAFDTAGPACAVAIARDGAILVASSEAIGRGQAERLMPMAEAALKEARVTFKDLERIAVTAGPGSFTGVRVGIAAARGLALALGIPAVGIGSLDALAASIVKSREAGTVVATLDAKRGEVYALAVDLATKATIVAATALAPDKLATMLAPVPAPLILIGNGAPLVAAVLGGRAVEIAGTPDTPDIADVARLGFTADAGSPPAPLYARSPDAKPQAGKAVAQQ